MSVGGCVCGSCKFCKPQNYTENGIVLTGREQVSDYTPTTEEVRAYSNYIAEEFDRWLAEVKAQAWEEGHQEPWIRDGDDGCKCGAWNSSECGCGKYGTGELLSLKDNPYRQGENK